MPVLCCGLFFLARFEEFLAVIRVGCIERSSRIVACYPVFGHEGSDVCIGVFVEQAVVPYAQADDYIQVGSGFIEQACLEDGVAHGCTDAFTPGRNAHRGLGLTGYLANHRVGLKAVGAQDAGEDTRFVDKPDAVGYADTSGVDFSGKLHDFLHACPLAIAFVFHFGAGYHYLPVVTLVISGQCPLSVIVAQVVGRAEVGISPILVFAILCATVHTAMNRFCFH